MKKTKVRLLLVEDDPDDAQLLMSALAVSGAYHFRVDWVRRLDDAFLALEHDRYDVILTDLNLGPTQGVETLLALRSRHPEVPIVVLSGIDDAATAILAMKGGAQDFLVKDHADRELVTRSIAYAMERHRIESALRRQTDELRAFTYAISHDLKSPLISIDYLIQEARERLQEGDRAEAIDQLLGAVTTRLEGMESLIHDINALAAADEGDTEDIVDLPALIDDVIDDNRPAAQERQVDVRPQVPDLPRVRGNRVQLRLLVTNLLANAIKYTRAPGGTVQVRARPLGQDGHGAWRIEVEDNGPGVPPEYRERIFQVFERAPDPLGRNIPGSGIGLAICAKVAHNHGTWVHVRDGTDGGALFFFDLPPARLVPGALGEDPTLATSAAPSGERPK